MAKIKRDIIKGIQEGKGKAIAKAFFSAHFTPAQVTRIIYKKAWEMRKEKNRKGFVMPMIQNYLAEWKKAGFINTNRLRIPVEAKGKKPYTLIEDVYILNLEPFYKYCKESHNIEFSKEEKLYLNLLFLGESQRLLILKEYPNEDVINALLKFYVKNHIIAHTKRINKEENKQKFDEIVQNADRRNKELSLKQGYDLFREIKETGRMELQAEDEEYLNGKKKAFPNNPELNKEFVKKLKGEYPKLAYSLKEKQGFPFISILNWKFMKILGIM